MNKQNTDKTFFEYCTALTLFYGIIHVKEAFDIIQFQYDAQYNLEDFLKYVEQMQETRFDPNYNGSHVKTSNEELMVNNRS